MSLFYKYCFIWFSLLHFFYQPIIPQSFRASDLKCPGGIPTSIYLDKKSDQFFAGCWGGIWEYDNSSKNWNEVDSDSSFNILANAKVTSLFIDSKGVFYAGCDQTTPSYISYDTGSKWHPINNINFTLQKINCFAEGKDGTVYLGTQTGIIKTTDNGVSWKKLKGISSYVNCFFINSVGRIFAGVSNGIFATTTSDSAWSQIKLPGLYREVYVIEKKSEGKLFAGANGDMYASDDDGNNWYSIKSSFEGTALKNNLVVNSITITGNDFVYIIAGFGGNCWRSIDHNQSWTILTYTPIELNNPNWSKMLCDSKENFFGLSTRYGAVKIEETTNVLDYNQKIVNSYSLSQNYPNPFNPNTVIQFSIPCSQFVTLKVFDLLGREVKTLVNEFMNTGDYKIDFNADNLSNGMYIYRLSGNNINLTKKMMLMK